MVPEIRIVVFSSCVVAPTRGDDSVAWKAVKAGTSRAVSILPAEERSVRLAVIGDVHLAFGPADVAYLDAQGYDAVLFVGDLSGYERRGALRVARYVRALKTRTFVIPGNHDTVGAPQLIAELTGNELAIELLASGQRDRVEELRRDLLPAELVGYSKHALVPGLAMIAARPHSFGGPHLAFRPYLMEAFRVASFESSASRLCALIDAVDEPRVLFLAHNGPTGLGETRDSIWGCDFRRSEGDFGDPDLEQAIAHARDEGKQVVAVVAGHMHHALRGRGTRKWIERRDETLYVNAARVPRVFKEAGAERRHFVEVVIDGERAEAREVLFSP
jgi:uncharacterized protein (TIGR04168 family)